MKKPFPVIGIIVGLLFFLPVFSVSGFEKIIYEGEDAVLIDVTVDCAGEGYSGTGYARGFTEDSGGVTFTVEIPQSGLYRLFIGYAAFHGTTSAGLKINGAPFGQVFLQETSGFSEVSTGLIFFMEGANTITVEKGGGGYYIDYIMIASPSYRRPHQVTNKLINPNATPEAKALMNFLVDNYGKYILSGQQEFPSKFIRFLDVDRVYNLTGKKPAVLGLDFMEYSPSRVERGASSRETEKAIMWHNQGGIVAFTWHWNAPQGLEKDGQPWWRGFYTEATTFDLAYALKNPDSEDYRLLLRDIDAIAAQLKILQENKVPVLWRPLHEAEGGWFWWGAKGPGPCIELWKLMYERLTNDHGLNNLIWVWNSVAEHWYPGDEWVDIVSYDSYTGRKNYSPVHDKFEQLINLTGHTKLIALGENGAIPDPDLLQEYNAHWSWFITWNGREFLEEWNDPDHLRKVYHHPFVLTLDELPDLYGHLDREGQ